LLWITYHFVYNEIHNIFFNFKSFFINYVFYLFFCMPFVALIFVMGHLNYKFYCIKRVSKYLKNVDTGLPTKDET